MLLLLLYSRPNFYVPNLEDATTYWNRNDSIGRRASWSVPNFKGKVRTENRERWYV